MEKNRSFKFVIFLDLVSIDAVLNDAEIIRLLYSELGLLETIAPITKAVAKVAKICREKVWIDARGLKDGMKYISFGLSGKDKKQTNSQIYYQTDRSKLSQK